MIPTMPKFNVEVYLESLSVAMWGTDKAGEDIIRTIRKAKESNRRVWILGNGGSLAIAQHFAQDLVKMRGIRAHAFTCPSMLTAYTNDQSFEESMSAPLSVLMDPMDPIIIFSCSGNSRNYPAFFKRPYPRGPIVSVVGCDGGFLKKESDICLHVQNHNYQICETAFCVVADLVIADLEE